MFLRATTPDCVTFVLACQKVKFMELVENKGELLKITEKLITKKRDFGVFEVFNNFTANLLWATALNI